MAGTGAGSAHAKAILVGEHFVVHGASAVVLPLPALTVSARAASTRGQGRVTGAGDAASLVSLAAEKAAEYVGISDVALDIDISGQVPVGRGLGSSAAYASAVVESVCAALGHPVDSDQVRDIVAVTEDRVHGTSSGIDAAAATSEVPVLFRAGRIVRSLTVPRKFDLVVADSTIVGHTRSAVAAVAAAFAADPGRRSAMLAAAENLARLAVAQLMSADLVGLGRTLTANHRLLVELGVSVSRLDELVEVALEAGAHGAKLTGGGLGGCILAVADIDQGHTVAAALAAVGAPTWRQSGYAGVSEETAYV